MVPFKILISQGSNDQVPVRETTSIDKGSKFTVEDHTLRREYLWNIFIHVYVDNSLCPWQSVLWCSVSFSILRPYDMNIPFSEYTLHQRQCRTPVHSHIHLLSHKWYQEEKVRVNHIDITLISLLRTFLVLLFPSRRKPLILGPMRRLVS